MRTLVFRSFILWIENYHIRMKYGVISRINYTRLLPLPSILTEVDEKLVVYQAMYGSEGIYARPLDMFMSEVDREKYPDVEQEYRFERIE